MVSNIISGDDDDGGVGVVVVIKEVRRVKGCSFCQFKYDSDSTLTLNIFKL